MCVRISDSLSLDPSSETPAPAIDLCSEKTRHCLDSSLSCHSQQDKLCTETMLTSQCSSDLSNDGDLCPWQRHVLPNSSTVTGDLH